MIPFVKGITGCRSWGSGGAFIRRGSLKNECTRSCPALGLFSGSLCRHNSENLWKWSVKRLDTNPPPSKLFPFDPTLSPTPDSTATQKVNYSILVLYSRSMKTKSYTTSFTLCLVDILLTSISILRTSCAVQENRSKTTNFFSEHEGRRVILKWCHPVGKFTSSDSNTI